jgi:hypothetical protein
MMLGRYTIIIEADEQEAFKAFGLELERALRRSMSSIRLYRFDNIEDIGVLQVAELEKTKER